MARYTLQSDDAIFNKRRVRIHIKDFCSKQLLSVKYKKRLTNIRWDYRKKTKSNVKNEHTMSALSWKFVAVILCAYIIMAYARPQAPEQPEPYEYQYEVKDPEKELFFNKNEAGDAAGKVSGQYSVWLPDGRLMTVAYTVEGENGFVPKVTFDTNNPLG